MVAKNRLRSSIFIVLLFCVELTFAQTTGPLGKIVDKATDEPHMGASRMSPNTSFGPAAGLDGNFFIINIPPATHSVQAKMMGYASVRMEIIHFSVTSTTNLQLKSEQTTLPGEGTVVTASAVSFRKDQTSSVRNVSDDQIAQLPIENVNQVIDKMINLKIKELQFIS